jgi:alpha-galactosidase
MKNVITLLFLSFATATAAQKFEGLAKTPPMGWNSWNTFEININEALVKSIADKFITEGYKDVGYNYIVIDDGWMLKERNEKGDLVPDPKKFPNGLKVTIDYVHAKGLKFGIYNCAGSKTCAGFPGSRGHEYQDALTYAALGVDYLKYDWCSTGKLNAEEAYITMRDALFAAKRPVVFSLCDWGNSNPWTWGEKVGHAWRISGDIYPCWDCKHDHGGYYSWGVLKILDMHPDIRQHAGVEHYNDYDMMEVGNGMTENEDRSHFSLWSMLGSPLMMGNDVRSASPKTHAIMTNKDMIAINQDPLSIQAFKALKKDSLDVFVKPLANDEWALCFLNRSGKPYNLTFDWAKNKLQDPDFKAYQVDFTTDVFNIKDVWNKKELGKTNRVLTTTIAEHDVLVVRLRK